MLSFTAASKGLIAVSCLHLLHSRSAAFFVSVKDHVALQIHIFGHANICQHAEDSIQITFRIFNSKQPVHRAADQRLTLVRSCTSPVDTMSARPSWQRGILYNNFVQSDVVIKCGGHSIYAHKAILMAASGLFYTAFSSNFLVRLTHR